MAYSSINLAATVQLPNARKIMGEVDSIQIHTNLAIFVDLRRQTFRSEHDQRYVPLAIREGQNPKGTNVGWHCPNLLERMAPGTAGGAFAPDR